MSSPVYAAQTRTTGRPVSHAAGPYGTLASADRGWNIRQDVAMKKNSGDLSLPESLRPTTVTAEELQEDVVLQQAAHRPAVEADIAPAAGGSASVKPVEAEATMPPVTSYPVMERASKPVIAPTPVSTARGNVYIQAGSFSVYENASKLVDKLEPFSPGKIDPIMMKGREFYRVRLGPFESIDRARALLGQVIDAGNPTARVVVD
jgi:rare lipoprotein A